MVIKLESLKFRPQNEGERKKKWLPNKKSKKGIMKIIMEYLVPYKTEWCLYLWVKNFFQLSSRKMLTSPEEMAG